MNESQNTFIVNLSLDEGARRLETLHEKPKLFAPLQTFRTDVRIDHHDDQSLHAVVRRLDVSHSIAAAVARADVTIRLRADGYCDVDIQLQKIPRMMGIFLAVIFVVATLAIAAVDLQSVPFFIPLLLIVLGVMWLVVLPQRTRLKAAILAALEQ